MKRCPCPTCQREGQHDPWCEVHVAGHEGEDCSCGLREQGRVVRKGPAAVFASVDPREKPS